MGCTRCPINKEKAYAMQKRYQTDAQVDAALHEHWNRLLSTYTVKSGDEKLDRISQICCLNGALIS